jgi:hypothetical protein
LGEAAQLVTDLVVAKTRASAAPPRLVAAAAPRAPEFEGSCSTSARIDRPLDVVFEALLDAAAWPKLLPHVKGIDMLYDDREYQEFIMHVASSTGLLAVRSIRRCVLNSTIDFFQPTPPAFLRHHGGGWIFRALPGGATEVETFHRWNLNHEVAQKTFSGPRPYGDQVRELLLEHACFALDCWRDLLSAKAA